MISHILQVAGVFVLGMALRACPVVLLQRLGTLTILGGSYLGGWKLTHSHAVSALFASSWLVLPWLEILTQIRKDWAQDQPIKLMFRKRLGTAP